MKDSTNNRSNVAASGRISILLFVVATIFAGAILFLPGTTATSPISTCTPVPANLIAWYRAENNASDFVGTNHGTLLNGATFAPGTVGQAFRFDGVDGMVNVPFTSAFNVASAVTIEAWVKTNSTVTGDHKLLAGRPGNYQLYKLDDGRPGFAVVIGGTFINAFSTTTLAANTLTHVAGTYDAATGLVKIYVNGSLTGTAVTAGNPDAGAQPFQIGGFGGPDVGNQFINNFGGEIDEVGLYNRSLSASEIQSIFNAGSAGKCPADCAPLPSNAVSWHRAENDADDSVGSNNGTLQNGAAFAAGKVGQAFNLDGTNDYVDIGNLAGLDNATGLTVMAWIKRQNAGNSDGAIVGKWRDRSTADNSFLLLLGGGGFAQNVGAFIIEFDNNTDGFLQDDTVIPIDTWTFVAATWRSSDGALKLYKNGIEEVSTTAGVGRTLRIHPAAFTAKIGEWGISPVSSTSPSFPGQIDEPAIFNRALTAAEIQAIYNADSAGKCLPPPCVPPPSEMVSWYRAEDNASDQVASNHGTLQNGTTFTAGKVGKAFSFDGLDDQVSVPDNQSLNPQTLTIEGWIKTSGAPSGNLAAFIAAKSGTGGLSGYEFGVVTSAPLTGRLRFTINGGTGGSDLIGTTGSSVFDNQFHHVAATYDGIAMRLYIDGNLDSEFPVTTSINYQANSPFVIGRRQLNSFRGPFNGIIDDLSVFNRALSSAEIQTIFAAGGAGKCVPCTPLPSNAVSWYRAENDALDQQGNNNGTLQNGATFSTGKVGQAFSLDGNNDFVRVGNPTALNFGTGDFSIQAWVKTSFRGGTFNDYIISKSSVGNDAQFVLSYNAAAAPTGTGFPSFLMSDGTTNTNASGTANLADGNFHHLAGVREGTTLRLYVDGVQVGTATTPSLVNATSANNVIIGGRDNPDFDPYFKGIIDEVQFFNRALSASEIQAIFNAGSAGVCMSTPLQISPTTQTVNIGGTVNFTATGGTQPYTFSLFANNSLATIDSASGAYTAGTLVGTDTVRVTDALGSTSDTTVTVSSAAPARLAFTVQPMNATAGQSIAPALRVTIQDNAGNTVTSANDPVTIAIGNNLGGSTLGGNVTRDAVNGIATFDNLSLNLVGTGYTLVASSGFLISTTSNAFNISAASAAQLFFRRQPSDTTANAVITPSVQVEIRDQFGNLVTASTHQITIGLANNPSSGTLLGPLTSTSDNGFATFNNLRINAGGNGYTLVASSSSLTPVTSSAFNILGATQLSFSVQPSNTPVNTNIAPIVRVAILDQLGNIVTNATNPITIAIGNNPAGGTLSGNLTSSNPDNGIAFFGNLRIDRGGNGYTLVATSNGLTSATSTAFSITGPTQLAFTVQPSSTTVNTNIAPIVQVAILDQFGNIVTNATNPVTIAIGNNPAGGTLSGNLTSSNPDNGIAFFGNLRIDAGGNGYTLVATSSGLTSATSSAFNIIGPTKLGFVVQPTNTTAGASISPTVLVALRDDAGNIVTSATNAVTIAIGNNPGSSTLGGTVTKNSVNGIASFANLSLNRVGTGYTLSATSGSLVPATSGGFNITVAPAAQLAFRTHPIDSIVNLVSDEEVEVEVRDQFGNFVSSATNSITLSIGNNPGGGTLFGSFPGSLTRNADDGIATFLSWRIDSGGHGYTLVATSPGLLPATSNPVNIFVPTQLAFTVQPPNSNLSTEFFVQVEVQDEFGNRIVVQNRLLVVTIAIGNNPAGGTLSGGGLGLTRSISDGVASWGFLSINRGAHGYTLVATSPGLTSATSNPFNIFGPTKLAFTVQPPNSNVSTEFFVQVEVQDEFGNRVTTSSNQVTIAIGNNPAGGTLSGGGLGLTRSTSNGVASWGFLSINRGAHGYTLVATSPGLTSATSNPFNVFGPTQLAFTVQPSNSNVNTEFSVQVEVQDEFGNRVTNSNTQVTIAISNNPGGGTLSGGGLGLTRSTSNGVAAWGFLSLNRGGHGYTLVASSPGLTPATSNPFNIFGATQLAFTIQPSNAGVGLALPTIQVEVKDEFGNRFLNTDHQITIAIGNNPSGGTLSQSSAYTSTTQGLANIGGLRIDRGGNAYTLVASSFGLTSATSNSFNISGPTHLAFLVQPSDTNVNAAFPTAVQVEVRNEFGQVLIANDPVTIAIGENPGGGTLAGTFTKNAVFGVATFNDLRISAEGNGKNLVATSGVLTKATSNTFNINGVVGLFVVTNTNDSGPGSLRQAILNANITPDTQTISFNITDGAAPFTIAPATDLPRITAPIIIDGTTQPGFAGSPIIELSGAASSSTVNGLWIEGGNSTVKGLAINGFSEGIVLATNGGNKILGNYLGTDVTGNTGPGNRSGILIESNNNLIGGATAATRNVISGNRFGIYVLSAPGTTSSGNMIRGNFIGTNANGTSGVPNQDGIVAQITSNLIIGGVLTGQSNVIAFNSSRGVSLEDSTAKGVAVRGNSIHSNGQLGIDLGSPGVSGNDNCDSDTGANNRQNFPNLTAINLTAGSTTIEGTLNSAPNQSYTIDFYANATADPSGYGEGQTHLGSASVATAANCNANFTGANAIVLTNVIPAGAFVTATATDKNGNTSEFSAFYSPTSVIIEGTVLAGGQPLPGALVTLKNLTQGGKTVTTTKANGRFKFSNLAPGNTYLITPTKSNVTFNPSTRRYDNLTFNQDEPYPGTVDTFTISGQVTLDSFALGSVPMNLTGAGNQRTSTDSSGNYSFNNLPSGTYTVAPLKAGYTFTPASSNLTINSNRTANFTATADVPGLVGRMVFGDSDGITPIGIKAMNANGSGLVTLVTGTVRQPDLSADGSKIVFVKEHSNGSYSIRTMNADGSGETQVISSIQSLRSPAWSHDKTKIAFLKGGSGRDHEHGIFVMDADGSNEFRVTANDSGNHYDPEWSPDGTKLAYYKDGFPFTGLSYNAYAIELGDPTFPTNLGDGKLPRWSPDGTKIAFVAQSQSSSSPSGLDESIVVMNAADYSGPTAFVSVPRLTGLEWSPDSTRLIYRESFIFFSVLHLILSDGTGDTQLDLPGLDSWSVDYRVPTPSGTNVTVQSGRVAITFPNTSGVNKTTSITPIDPASAGTTPGGFRLGNMAYEISTTASFTPPVEVCFTVAANLYPTPPTFAPLIIFHNENGVLVPRPPTSKDFPSRTICAEVNSFSPFALGEQVDETLPSISGLVVDQNGNPLHNIAVALSGDQERFTTTDQDGLFHFVNLVQNGNYLVQPTQTGYLYDFPYQSFIHINGEETVAFTATAAAFDISGSVIDRNSGPLSNILVQLNGGVRETTTDVNGKYSFTDIPANGTLTVTPIGESLAFTPSQASIASLTDNLSAINFVVGPPPANQSPNAAADAANTNQNAPITIAVLSNDIDPDGDVLTITDTSQGTNGAVVINADNTVTYSPNAGFTGPDSFSYTISDGRGGSASATVNVTVSQVNRPPTVVVQNITHNVGSNCQAVVTAQEVGGASSDPDGDAITLILTPAGPFAVGAHPVTVTVTDSHGASASASATVTVIDNTPPAITCPSNIVVAAAPGQSSAVVNYSVTATDNCSNVTVTATHPSGSSFPVGVTTVAVTATDAGGTTATCSFTVTVNGSTAPPDKIAFDSTRDGNLEIYSMNADGTNQTRLTSNSALDFKPTWSPDRSKIAFTSSRTGNGDIYVMNANGTNQTRLTSNSAIEDDASWSPDGTKIAFWSNRDGNPEIYVMNANGTNQTRLTSNSAWDTQPKWSPDGTRLAFVSNRNGVLNFDIYVMNANGSQVNRLTTSSSIDESPDWSPDGSKIVFTSNRSNLLDFEIWVMNTNGSAQTRLTASTRSSVRPAWSRNGTQITFATNRLALLNFEIYSMNANGTNQTRLTNNSAIDFNPDR